MTLGRDGARTAESEGGRPNLTTSMWSCAAPDAGSVLGVHIAVCGLALLRFQRLSGPAQDATSATKWCLAAAGQTANQVVRQRKCADAFTC